MPELNPQHILRAIAKRMRSKVSNCEHYDPNVCNYEADSNDIAKVITNSGQPFVKPYFGTINSYLDRSGEQPQPDAAVALGALAEFAAESDLWLKENE